MIQNTKRRKNAKMNIQIRFIVPRKGEILKKIRRMSCHNPLYTFNWYKKVALQMEYNISKSQTMIVYERALIVILEWLKIIVTNYIVVLYYMHWIKYMLCA